MRPHASDRTIEDNGRYADAYAGFIRNRFTLGRWFVTLGLRIESVSYVRKNLLSAAVAKGNGNVSEPLPSFAIGYKAFEWANLFFDLHKGFSPPRVEDSIYNNGMSTEIASEQSWNFELGVRSRPWIGVQTDIVGFHNSFDNLTAVGTVGGNDTPVAQGKALFEGLEFQNRIDFGELFDSGHNPYLSISYSWIGKAEAATAFRCLPLSDGSIPLTCPGGFVYGSSAGKRLPYSPEHLLVAKLGYSHPIGMDVNMEISYTADQYADFMNLHSGRDHPNGPNSVEARSGQYGKIQNYTVLNFSGTYAPVKGLDIYFTIKNLLDNQYITDRVRGILPGSPRLVQAGFRYRY